MLQKNVTSTALFLLILFLAFPHVLFAQQHPAYSEEVEARIKQVERSLGETVKTDDRPLLLQERMKFYQVPGVSIAVVKDFKIDWARGYGFADKEQALPVTSQTLFQAASISKSLNAVGVLRLVQDKKVDLDRDINTYLSSWQFPYDTSTTKKIITLRNLLSHTAGTSVHGFGGYAAGEKIPSLIQILNGLAPANSKPVRALFAPGTKVQYSGGGTIISQQIVMDVARQSYGQYALKQVLAPLGMHNSFFTLPSAQQAKFLSTGYRQDGKPIAGKYHLYPEQAAASLWTNPTELSKYIIEMQEAYAGRSKKVLNQESVRTMFTPVLNNAALGVFIKAVGTDRYFMHGGGNEGFRCLYLGSIEGGNGVVVMVNSDNGQIIDEIVNSIASVYGWKDYYKPVIRKLVEVPDDVLDTYVGEYELNPNFKVTITRSGHSLKAQATGQPPLDLFAYDQNKFFFKAFDGQIEFHKDKSNKVTKLISHQDGQSGEILKVK